jgi:hypothetical protein
MGPYCDYCDDRRKLGYDHQTAINCMIDPRFQHSPEDRLDKMVNLIVHGLSESNKESGGRIYGHPGPDNRGDIIIELPSFQPGVTERLFRLRVEELPLDDEEGTST